MIRRRIPILLAFILLAGLPLRAQVNDAQLWLSATLEKRLTSSLSLGFTQEVRLNENITEVGTIYSDLGVSYRFLKRFKGGIAYRFTLKRRLDDTYKQYHSWYAEGSYREKLKPVTMILRLRYQSRYSEAYTSEQAGTPQDHFRTKLTFKYNLDKRFDPYVYGEAFFRTSPSEFRPFDELRLCAGIEYTINRMHMIDLHYLFLREYNVVNPETDYVVGIGYYFTF